MDALPSFLLLPALLVLAWMQFLFVSGRANPFRRPGPPLLRRRWSYGCRVALAVLAAVAVALLANALAGFPASAALAAGALAYALLVLWSTLVFRRHAAHRQAATTSRTLASGPSGEAAKVQDPVPGFGTMRSATVARGVRREPASILSSDGGSARLKSRPVDIVV